MKIIVLTLCIFALCLGKSEAQSSNPVFVKGEYFEKPLLEFIHEMETAYNLKFFYVEEKINSLKVSGIFKYKTPLDDALEQLLKGTGIYFYSNSEGIVLYERSKEEDGARLHFYKLKGQVTEKSSGDPLPFVNVYIPALSKGAVTDEKGRFEIKPVLEGKYSVTFHFVGYKPLMEKVDVNSDTDVAVSLEETFVELKEVSISPGAHQISTVEVSPMTLGKEEILHSPNFAKDIFRTLRTLPGIVSDDFSAKARIRGGHSSEVGVYLDNFNIKRPFHLEEVNGAFSIFNTDYVNDLTVHTGGFSAKYLDRLSGIMDVRSYNYIEKDQADVFVDLLNMGLRVQKKIGKAHTFLALRRGYLDWLLGSFEGNNPDARLRPRFYDVWSKVNVEINKKNQVSAHLLYARDNFLYDDVDPFGNRHLLQNITQNNNIWFNWKYYPAEQFGLTATAGYQELSEDARFKFAESVFDQNFDRKHSRAVQGALRLYWDVAPNHSLEAGVEGEAFRADYFYREMRYDIFEATPESLQLDTVFVDTGFGGYLFSAYVQDSWKPWSKLTVQPGLRISAQSYTEKSLYWSPRLAVQYTIAEPLDIRLGAGVYHQPDAYFTMRTALGQTRPFRDVANNRQYTASVNYHTDKLVVQANLYYKDYHVLFDDYRFEFFNRIVGVNILDRPFDPSSGMSKGLEIMARKPYGSNFLMVSYALADNRIYNEQGEATYRDFDQRHTVIVENIFRLPAHWNISLLWRYHTGHPYTPSTVNFVGQSDFSDRAILFYEMGRKNNARLPATHSLDLKIEKNWFFSRGKLTAYVNIVNLYDRENVRSYWWEIYRDRRSGEITTQRNYQSNIPFFISPGLSFTLF